MSDSNMDDLLAQLKASRSPDRASNRKAAGKSQLPQSASMPSIRQLLDRLGKDIESGKIRPSYRPQPQTDKPSQEVRNLAQQRGRLNASIDAEYRKQVQLREAKLTELKRQEEARNREAQRRERELIEAQKREELRERRRKAALREKAQQWLKSLDMRSEEGRWFEEFSYSYEDKLQAAIDYLEAMRETGMNY